ncbi:hypothetical protein BURMUCF2_B0510 [Burkholderia multivorans CF2]|nr:hypothetical protein BURMUCF2_B0510 [Burkholderia multivorans CF2]
MCVVGCVLRLLRCAGVRCSGGVRATCAGARNAWTTGCRKARRG